MEFKADNVRFMADDSRLVGMYCFFSSNASQLQQAVVGDIHGTVGKLKFTGETEHPFQLLGTTMTYKFCYPLWCSCFFALYSKGKTIYYNSGSADGWRVVPPSTEISDRRYWSNDFVYTDVCPHCLSSDVSSDVSSGRDSNVSTSDGSVDVTTNCTWGQLAEWLASGMGLCLRPDGSVVNSVCVSVGHLDAPVMSDYYVRAFGSDEWRVPTAEYIADSLG